MTSTQPIALSVWWICNKCAFWNYPRINQNDHKCQQCGKDQDQSDKEYDPQQGGRR